MDRQLFFLERLGLSADADERAIRRAYARELKLIDQESDAAGFQTLREAYETALRWARRPAASERTGSTDGVDVDVNVDAHEAGRAGPGAAGLAHTGDADGGRDVAAADATDVANISASDEAAGAADHAAGGATVFTELLAHCDSIRATQDLGDDAVWERLLRSCLADPRLVNIAARGNYELHIALLLVNGWRPGHEALLPAAIRVFQWDRDRRRILALGQAGAMIDAAIDQRATFEMQAYNEQARQRAQILRLREPREPTTRELLHHGATLEMLIARFPEWLALIVSVPAAMHWRERYERLPNWRRRLAGMGRGGKTASASGKQGGRFNWAWLVLVLILAGMAAGYRDGPNGRRQTAPAMKAGTANARNLVRVANGQLNGGDPATAIATYGYAVKHDPDHAPAYAGRAMALYWTGQYGRAASDAERAIELDKTNPVPYRVRALLAMQGEQVKDALADFTRAIALDPGHAYTYYRRALAYEAEKQYEQARADAEHALRLAADMSDVYVLLARLHQARGDKAGAERQAEALIAARPGDPQAYLGAARIHEALEQPRAALAALDRGMKAGADIRFHLLRAQLLPRADSAGRRAAIDAALAMNPREPDALRQRGDLEYDARRYQAAIDSYTEALKGIPDGPRRADPLMLRGTAYAKTGQAQAAKRDFDAASQAAGTVHAMNAICWYLGTGGIDLATALKNCDAALAADPGYVEAWDSKGLVLLKLGRSQQAADAYDAALARRPALAHARYGRGLARLALGKREGEADLRAALAADAGLADAYARYGLRRQARLN